MIKRGGGSVKVVCDERGNIRNLCVDKEGKKECKGEKIIIRRKRMQTNKRTSRETKEERITKAKTTTPQTHTTRQVTRGQPGNPRRNTRCNKR